MGTQPNAHSPLQKRVFDNDNQGLQKNQISDISAFVQLRLIL